MTHVHGDANGAYPRYWGQTHQSLPDSARAGLAVFPAAAEAKEVGAIVLLWLRWWWWWWWSGSGEEAAMGSGGCCRSQKI